MEKLLWELLTTENPELIEKYIDKYLPKDPANLQRIYSELKDYEPSQTKDEEIKKQSNSTHKHKPLNYNERTSSEQMIKRSKSLMLNLKDKGLKVSSDLREEGNKIYENKYNRIKRPLKMNPHSPFLKSTNFHQIIEKYEMNKHYYGKKVEEAGDDGGLGFEPEIIEFINRKNKLLTLIREKKNINQMDARPKAKKYRNVASRAFNESKVSEVHQSSLPSLEKASPPKKSLERQMSVMETQQIMTECLSATKSNFNNNKQKNNLFEVMGDKLRLHFYQNHDIDNQLQNLVKGLYEKQQYERYKRDYIKSMKMKPEFCKVNKHQRDLLKNQIRMRELENMKGGKE